MEEDAAPEPGGSSSRAGVARSPAASTADNEEFESFESYKEAASLVARRKCKADDLPRCQPKGAKGPSLPPATPGPSAHWRTLAAEAKKKTEDKNEEAKEGAVPIARDLVPPPSSRAPSPTPLLTMTWWLVLKSQPFANE